jgi:hypothetical protein
MQGLKGKLNASSEKSVGHRSLQLRPEAPLAPPAKWSEKTEISAERCVEWLDVAASKFYDWQERYGVTAR